jgi:methionyl aminopeptidase
MIIIKNKSMISKMVTAGKILSCICADLKSFITEGISTLDIDTFVAQALQKNNMISKTKGYMGYRHSSCVSINDEIVHGVPSAQRIICDGDVVTVDICASWNGYCADMARNFFIGNVEEKARNLVKVAQQSLDAGIQCAVPGNYLSDISAAIQKKVESNGYGVVRDFAGHGIGKSMHEEPELLNYGKPGEGPVLRAGMAMAIEPMITAGSYEVCIEQDGWTAKTVDNSLAAHVEDTVIITENGPLIITRHNNE